MSSEKTEQATEHHLREARKKGQIATSMEVNAAAGFAAVVAYLLVEGGAMAAELHVMFSRILTHIQEVGRPDAPGTTAMLLELGMSLAKLCLTPLLLGAVVAMLVGLAQTKVMLSLKVVEPDLAHVNPVSGMGRVFSLQNLLSVLKLLLGLLVITAIVTVMFRDMLPQMLRSGYAPRAGSLAMTWYLISRLLMAGVLVAALMAVADRLVQNYTHLRNLRMSKQDLQDEHKNIEGDPTIKAYRRQKLQEILDEDTRKDIAGAQVVVTNPTHVAVAIRYEPGVIDLPMVSAKGLDDVALEIRRLAEEAGVPIYEDRSLARALYRDCRRRDYVSHQYFEAVAEVFKWLAKIKGAKNLAQRVAVPRGSTS